MLNSSRLTRTMYMQQWKYLPTIVIKIIVFVIVIIGFVSNKYIPSRSRDLVHVLALQLVQLSEYGYHQVNYN